MWPASGRREMHYEVSGKNLNETDYLEEVDVDGRIY